MAEPVLTPDVAEAVAALERAEAFVAQIEAPDEYAHAPAIATARADLLAELAREREAGEELAAEVLAARVRLGEAAWTFKDQNADALQGLAAKGLVWVKAGVVEGTLLSGFTDEGRAAYLSEKYEPPVEGRVRKLQEALELLATMNWTGVAEAEEASDWVRKVASEALVGLPE